MRSWNEDPYTKKARRENHLARSHYKLEEIDRKEQILKKAKYVLDLGAAPGSWSEYCLEKLPNVEIFAVDLNPLQVQNPRLKFIEASIEDVDFESFLNHQKMDVVLSDMAPNTSGNHVRDTALSFELASLALSVAQKHLKTNGHFVAKLFMGEDFENYRKNLQAIFKEVSLVRPDSTRKQSREIFFVGKYLASLQ